jgi:peptide/nickel transport system ATP-binding protein/oligopeptide transport system ATP-binding protein
MTENLLEVENLVKYFPVSRSLLAGVMRKTASQVHAVDDVSLTIAKNETLGLVGESGSGKTTLGRTVLMLERRTSGRITFQGQTISEMKGDELRAFRKKMQIVFQDPYSSLDPRARVKDIIAEPLRAYGTKKDAENETVERVATAVNLPIDGLSRFPHEFSGGQRQRIAIARAMVLEPQFIVLDEPTSALDSSVQAQILNLLRRMQEELGLTYLLITHNVGVVRYMANRMAIMYCGKLAEVGSTREVLEQPLHPYTAALISSIPQPDPTKRVKTMPVTGEVPSAVNPPRGCRFNPRCRYVQDKCRMIEPTLREILPGHWAACHFAEEFIGMSAPPQLQRSS